MQRWQTQGMRSQKIREHSPEISGKLESGDHEVLNLGKAILESLPIDPIFANPIFTEMVEADAEENARLKAKMNEESTRKIVQMMAIDLEGSSLKVKAFIITFFSCSNHLFYDFTLSPISLYE